MSLTLLLANGATTLLAQTRTGARPRPAAASPAATANDIKVRARTTTGGHSFEDTQYIKGARERREMNAGSMNMVTLMQCDMKRQIQINDQTRTYMINRLEGESAAPPAAPRAATARTGEPARRGGVITYVNTSTDTGERKQMFGFTARRIKTVTTVESSPDACDQTKMRSETDGWYIDIKYGLDCRNLRAATPNPAATGGGCTDQFRFKQVGVAELGFPVDITMTHYGADGAASTTMRREVLELSRQPLDAALFDVPAGYTEAANYQQLVTGAGAGRASNTTNDDEDGETSSDEQTGGARPSDTNQQGTLRASALGPKRQGVVRVGVAMPRAQMGQGSSAADYSAPLRNLLAQYLNGPAVEIAPLDARVPSQIALEAREKECDFVLHTSFTQKKGSSGGGFGGFMRKAAPAVGLASVGATSTAGAVAVSAASTAAYTAAEISAASVKAKDEITIEYQLTTADGSTPRAASSVKARAKSDGEDVLSPLVAQVATAVLNAVAGR